MPAPALLASSSGNLKIVKFLIDELNFDPAVEGYLGADSFAQACKKRKINIVNFLAKRNSTVRKCSFGD